MPRLRSINWNTVVSMPDCFVRCCQVVEKEAVQPVVADAAVHLPVPSIDLRQSFPVRCIHRCTLYRVTRKILHPSDRMQFLDNCV